MENEPDNTSEIELDPTSKKFVADLINKMQIFMHELIGYELFPYQTAFSRRIMESVVINDAEEITALFARQCLDGDTIILRRDGTACRIRNHEDAWVTGERPTKRYTCRGGASFVATENHPVMTPDGWIPAGQLKIGTNISTLSAWDQWIGRRNLQRVIKVGRWQKPVTVEKKITIEIARLLGYFCTDGSLRPGQSPKFTNTNNAYLDEFDDICETEFGFRARWYAKGNGWDLLLTTDSHSSFDNPLLDFLHAVRWDARFPTDVFSWAPDLIAEFLNRAWAGNGCISMRKSGPDVFLACSSEVQARYFQLLLQKLGVASTVRYEWMAKSTQPFHRLVLGCGAKNIRHFFGVIGPVFGKEAQCHRALGFFDARLALPSGKGRTEREMRPQVMTGTDGEKLTWAPIVSIADVGVREVWDVEYPDKGWFIAQGAYVSNSGKTETVADTVVSLMILLPKLAPVYPDLLGKFKDGLWVGVFAPTGEQADTLFSRMVARLTSERATEILLDPELDDRTDGRGQLIRLKNSGSFCRMQTAHPRAKIESKSYHLLIIDEAQAAHEQVIRKSVHAMGAFYSSSIIKIGTPDTKKGDFYKAIQLNKRRQTQKGARQNHFESPWTECAKYNKNYARFVQKEMERLGEDSDEFVLSYSLKWLLDRGMFVTSSVMNDLGDMTMNIVQAWYKSPVLAGIDVARKVDSTVVTVVWVDWDHPDEYGYYDHRILNWLEMRGDDWEEQYFRIVDFLSNYDVMAVAVDAQGVGDVVANRLARLLPRSEVHALLSTRPEQSKRWKHLMELLQRRMIAWPAHSRTRRLKVWQRFNQQMLDLEKNYEGPHLLAAAPDENQAHDDYPQSLALACALTRDMVLPYVTIAEAPFYERRRY